MNQLKKQILSDLEFNDSSIMILSKELQIPQNKLYRFFDETQQVYSLTIYVAILLHTKKNLTVDELMKQVKMVLDIHLEKKFNLVKNDFYTAYELYLAYDYYPDFFEKYQSIIRTVRYDRFITKELVSRYGNYNFARLKDENKGSFDRHDVYRRYENFFFLVSEIQKETSLTNAITKIQSFKKEIDQDPITFCKVALQDRLMALQYYVYDTFKQPIPSSILKFNFFDRYLVNSISLSLLIPKLKVDLDLRIKAIQDSINNRYRIHTLYLLALNIDEQLSSSLYMGEESLALDRIELLLSNHTSYFQELMILKKYLLEAYHELIEYQPLFSSYNQKVISVIVSNYTNFNFINEPVKITINKNISKHF